MKYVVQIALDDTNKRIVADTLDELPEKVRPVIALLDAMELQRIIFNMYVECEYGNKTVYIGVTYPHEAYYNVWGHP